VRRLLRDVRPGNGSPLAFVAVTGGRSADLPGVVDGVPIVAVDESAATAAGAVREEMAVPAVVVSLGTGTGLVLARPPDEPLRLIGSGVGGGTLVGLGRLLLGTGDPGEIGRLAERGDPVRCDLSVEDIVGRGIGPVRGEATASHFGRLVRPDGSSRPEDVAAALVRLVGQTALRLSIDSVLLHQARSIVLVGHVLDVPGFRESILETPGVDPNFVHLPVEPGFAAARGAVTVALRTRPDLAR
jgi:type II pantothenate kinase